MKIRHEIDGSTDRKAEQQPAVQGFRRLTGEQHPNGNDLFPCPCWSVGRSAATGSGPSHARKPGSLHEQYGVHLLAGERQ